MTTQTRKRIRWVTATEYAEMYGLSTRTVRRRVKNGLIPGVVQPAPGHAMRIPIPG